MASLPTILFHGPITKAIIPYLQPEDVCRLSATCRFFRHVWLEKYKHLYLFTQGQETTTLLTMKDWQLYIWKCFSLSHEKQNWVRVCIGCSKYFSKASLMAKKLYHAYAICKECFCKRMREPSLTKAVRKVGFALYSDMENFLQPYLSKQQMRRADDTKLPLFACSTRVSTFIVAKEIFEVKINHAQN